MLNTQHKIHGSRASMWPSAKGRIIIKINLMVEDNVTSMPSYANLLQAYVTGNDLWLKEFSVCGSLSDVSTVSHEHHLFTLLQNDCKQMVLIFIFHIWGGILVKVCDLQGYHISPDHFFYLCSAFIIPWEQPCRLLSYLWWLILIFPQRRTV